MKKDLDLDRIYMSAVSSEDIKADCNADSLMSYLQIGYGIMIIAGDVTIGCIDFDTEFLGADLYIKSFHMYNSPKLSKDLTEKYKGKLLIGSRIKDRLG